MSEAGAKKRAGAGPDGPVLEAVGLSRSFGPIEVLSDVSVSVRAGEVHAIIGENGAGKSTLMKILAGHLAPTRGAIKLDGSPVELKGPVDAERRGVVLVHQEIMLAPDLSIAENMFLGREMRKQGILGAVFRQLDKKRMRQQAAEQMHNLGIRVQSIRQAIETLSGGQRQAVAVARAAAWGRKVVILDEPTAALGVRETHQVLDLIRRVSEHGLFVVLISHSMPEVFAIADRIHIHRLGRRAAIVSPKTTVMSDVVAVMTGALPSDAVVSAVLAPAGAPDF